MLTVRKLLYDNENNVSIVLKHKEYTIRVFTRNYYNIVSLLSRYGENLRTLNRHNEYSRKKEFKERCFKLKDYWFVRKKEVSKELIEDILNKKHHYYEVIVIVSKYSVGLVEQSSLTASNYFFKKVSSIDSKAELITLINEVIKRTFIHVGDYESIIFGRDAVHMDYRR